MNELVSFVLGFAFASLCAAVVWCCESERKEQKEEDKQK